MSKYLLRLIQQALILTFISFLILSGPVDEYPHSCADYNFGAVHAAKAGLKNVYMCPQKSGVVCNESFPIKDFSSISQSHLKWKDVILSVLVGDGSSTDAFFWWISFINEEMDLVLLGDALFELTLFVQINLILGTEDCLIWLNEENVGNEQKGGLCYGAGGAGYGLNNVAMKAVAQLALTKAASVPACAYPGPNYGPDYSAEDFFIAFVMYRAFSNAVLLHCEGFRSGPEEKSYIKKYISLHHISRNWVGSHNSSLGEEI
eukprot:gene23668-32041_t